MQTALGINYSACITLVCARREVASAVGQPGHDSVPASMLVSAQAWLAQRGLQAMGAAVGPFFTGCGYGFMEDDQLPAASFLKVSVFGIGDINQCIAEPIMTLTRLTPPLLLLIVMSCCMLLDCLALQSIHMADILEEGAGRERWAVAGGFGELWRRVAAALPDVRCGCQVRRFRVIPLFVDSGWQETLF